MAELVEFTFNDGTTVLVSALPVQGATLAANGVRSGDEQIPDLPEGSVPVTPIGRGRDVVVKAGTTLVDVLRPLVPVLQSLHETLSEMEGRPDEVTVQLGVKLSNDIKLCIVGAAGEAGIVVSAKWSLPSVLDQSVSGEAETSEAGAVDLG